MFSFFKKDKGDPISTATRQLEKNPRDVLALIERAKLFMKKRDAKSAIQDVDRALQIALLEPKLAGDVRNGVLAHLYTIRSEAFTGLGDSENALSSINEALQVKPEYVEAIVQRGRIDREAGKLQSALEYFDRAIHLDPKLSNAYVARGMTYAELHDYKQAIADYDKAIGLDDQSGVALSNRGWAYFALKKHQQAEADCRKAVQLDPYLVKAYDLVAFLCQGRSDFREALRILAEGLKYQPLNADLMIRQARIYIELNKMPEALSILNGVLQQTPKHSEVYALRGQIAGRRGDFLAAINDLKKSIELNPRDPETHFNLALAYAHMKDYRAAIPVLEQVLALSPNDIEARNFYMQLKNSTPS